MKVAIKTCLATARERSPLSANLSIIAWMFLFVSSLSLHRSMICLPHKFVQIDRVTRNITSIEKTES